MAVQHSTTKMKLKLTAPIKHYLCDDQCLYSFKGQLSTSPTPGVLIDHRCARLTTWATRVLPRLRCDVDATARAAPLLTRCLVEAVVVDVAFRCCCCVCARRLRAAATPLAGVTALLAL